MARAIKQGQHIFIAFQDGEAVLDSQLRPRMYKSREQFEKSFPGWRDGKAELVEYAPTLTPPNEWVSVEERLPEDDVSEHKMQIAVLVLTDRETVKIKNRTYHPEKFYYGKFYPERWDWGIFNDDRITHWMLLPAPPDRRPPEGGESNA